MRFQKYESRFQAGKILAEFIEDNNSQYYNHIQENPNRFFCFAIPNGGVPVSEGFCSHFYIKFDILIVRKIKIPYNTEAGFGSVTTNGSILFNERLLSQLNLSKQSINDSIDLTKAEIRDRLRFYHKNFDLKKNYEEQVRDKNIFIIDDGLASGFTMLAAIKMIRNYNPENIIVAVPTAPLRTIKLIQPEVNKVFCPNIRDVMWFAVADAYKYWYDLSEEEVLKLLQNSQFYLNNDD